MNRAYVAAGGRFDTARGRLGEEYVLAFYSTVWMGKNL